MGTILDTIIETIQEEEKDRFRTFSIQDYPLQQRSQPLPIADRIGRGFFAIAEIKRGSPSRGLFAPAIDPPSLAQDYEAGGAAAISVITERRFFYGSPGFLKQVRPATTLPLLRKDFLIHPCQVYDAYNLGADFILLIAACHSGKTLKTMAQAARDLGLGVLVEVHDEAEIDRATACCPDLIGINNRDLRDFSVDFRRSLRLRGKIPAPFPVISESGIGSREQVQELRRAGFAGILVGEHLIRSGDPKSALQELLHD